MKNRLLLFISYFAFWLVFFAVSKVIFLLYQQPESLEISFIDWLWVLWHGNKLDLSATAYILIFPNLLILITSFFNGKFLSYALNTYTLLFVCVFSFLTIVDLELYRNWGYHLDSTALLYTKNTDAMMASVKVGTIVKLLIIGVVFATISSVAYLRLIGCRVKAFKPSNWLTVIVFLILTPALIIPIRGGIDIIPINVGSVYFHEKTIANHAAVNVPWNIMYSLTEMKELGTSFTFYDDDKAQKIFDDLSTDNGEVVSVLNTKKPNIIVIVLESFTSKIIGELGGDKRVTPNINSLCKEGILFDNFYASGDRTDKGLLAVISGYPAQPKTNIMVYPNKTDKLPYLPKNLEQLGYKTSFHYGGVIDFANLRSYLVNAGFDQIVTKSDFASKHHTSKWGVHDHIVFDRFLNDINDATEPFFNIMLTLSSHEPFDVPMETVIKGEHEDSLFLNSAVYTDKCLGDFIAKAKLQKWWKNSLIIMVADHGSRRPGNTVNHKLEKYQIPMLWLGGALAKTDTIIHTYASQTDIPTTILNQLDVTSANDEFIFSKNIFSSTPPAFAFYVFNNGFGFMSKQIQISHDNTNNQYYRTDTITTDYGLDYGRAYQQIISKDFNRR